MSIWYQIEINLIGDQASLAKFFNINKEDISIDNCSLVFGQKNGHGLHIDKIVEQNPNLVFLIKQEVDCYSLKWWLQKFDKSSGRHLTIKIVNKSPSINEINKKILQEYNENVVGLTNNHENNNGNDHFYDWKMFFTHFAKAAEIINNCDQYNDMRHIFSEEDMQYDLHDPHNLLDNDIGPNIVHLTNRTI